MKASPPSRLRRQQCWEGSKPPWGLWGPDLGLGYRAQPHDRPRPSRGVGCGLGEHAAALPTLPGSVPSGPEHRPGAQTAESVCSLVGLAIGEVKPGVSSETLILKSGGGQRQEEK